MSNDEILIDRQGRVEVITLNRPDKRNAWTNSMMLSAWAAVRKAGEDPEVRAIVITGAGSAFSSGADVDEFKAAYEMSKATGVHRAALDHMRLEEFAVEIRRVRKPIIAAINGAAVGLGFSVPLAADIRIASEKARLGAIFLRMALGPEFGSSYNLTRLVGIAKACELVFTARIIDAQEAKEIGLVNHVVPHDELMPFTMEMAQTMAKMPAQALSFAKDVLYNGLDAPHVPQIHTETLSNQIGRQHADHEEGILAFLEKREPNWG